MIKYILPLLLLTSTAHAMDIEGPVTLEREQSNVIDGLQAMIEGKVPPGSVCYASVQDNTFLCKPMVDRNSKSE